jgi:cysteine desulfurase
MTQPTYLDCAATCPLDPRVADLMLRQAMDCGNPGSRTHDYGNRARKAVEHARDQVAAVTASRRSEVIFTSGATESNNLAILGLAAFGRESGRTHIVTTQIEHPAVQEPILELERQGFLVTRIAPHPGGWVDAQDVLQAVRPDTLLVSVMHVNNETGVAQPIAEIADGLDHSPAQFHVDAAQSFGKLIEPLRHPRIDLIAACAHKIMGPQGIGREQPSPLRPLLFGGGQERGLRPGTLPAHLIAAFGLAAELALSEAPERHCHAINYRADLLAGLAPLEPLINGEIDRASPYLINLSLPGLDCESVMDAWRDIAAVSNGSACASQQAHCSYVLSAMGLGRDRADGAIRISWCPLTPPPDCASMVQAIQALPQVGHALACPSVSE